MGYLALTSTLPWFHKQGTDLDYDEYLHLMKMVSSLDVTYDGRRYVHDLSLASAGS